MIIDFLWESDIFNRVSLLRDLWLQRTAGKGNDAVVRKLLTVNVDVNVAAATDHDRTALQAVAEHEVIMMVLQAAAGPQ